ncbi:hypothetical protein HPB52_023537 [Rhipicephalus sanguineus]|uniref:Uncharacterized protein n=1 Tax=Rhipicephalus sanguineus TaxID=34632 RepID=A0A9D4PG71_RHISA|nr:hypothetical protein HPB52_023537 [Rhipicephalus sanguineus]
MDTVVMRLLHNVLVDYCTIDILFVDDKGLNGAAEKDSLPPGMNEQRAGDDVEENAEGAADAAGSCNEMAPEDDELCGDEEAVENLSGESYADVDAEMVGEEADEPRNAYRGGH